MSGAARRLILASRSPQRRAILEQIGVAFDVEVTDVEELQSGDPVATAAENARRKAYAAAERVGDARAGGNPILGVDTIVVVDGEIHGKPADREHARRTLRRLDGRDHDVISGLCMIDGGRAAEATARTAVSFAPLSEATLEWYLDTGEWRERAGGYAIQGRGALLVSGITGDYLNVVGLPVAALVALAPWLIGG